MSVAHIELDGGKLKIQILVSRNAGMFSAAIPISATPVELELFLMQVKTIVTRRQAEKRKADNEPE